MNIYNKNIASIVIVICLISVFINIFIPRNKTDINPQLNQLEYSHQISPLSFKCINVPTPFNSERIASIKIDGVINDSTSSSFFKDLSSSTAALEQIVKASNDQKVKAIVIRINSPGGTVGASQELYKAVISARKRKPIVITMGDIAASGGYYIASAADAIFANPGTITGSIGVITSYLNFYDLLNKLGVKGITIKSGEFKDLGNPTRPLLPQERAILQSLLDDTYDQFISDVAHGRKMQKKEIASIAKGLIYTGKQARKIGLVDYLGDYSQALQHAQKLAKKRFPTLAKKYGKKDLPVEETWKGSSFLDSLVGAQLKNSSTNILDNRIFKYFSYSRFQPLWLLE